MAAIQHRQRVSRCMRIGTARAADNKNFPHGATKASCCIVAEIVDTNTSNGYDGQ